MEMTEELREFIVDNYEKLKEMDAKLFGKLEIDRSYFVLYIRDFATEEEKHYGERMLFDKCRDFAQLQRARKFAFDNMPSVLGKRSVLSELSEEEFSTLKDADKPYLAIAKHYGKYKHYFMGEGEPITTYDVYRCQEEELEEILRMFRIEDTPIRKRELKELVNGVELKIF